MSQNGIARNPFPRQYLLKESLKFIYDRVRVEKYYSKKVIKKPFFHIKHKFQGVYVGKNYFWKRVAKTLFPFFVSHSVSSTMRYSKQEYQPPQCWYLRWSTYRGPVLNSPLSLCRSSWWLEFLRSRGQDPSHRSLSIWKSRPARTAGTVSSSVLKTGQFLCLRFWSSKRPSTYSVKFSWFFSFPTPPHHPLPTHNRWTGTCRWWD